MNDKEIHGQAFVFFMAGYETTSVLLSFFFYVMATEPVVQEKVYEEIQREIGDVSQLIDNDERSRNVFFRMKSLMKICINSHIWTWSSVKHFECIHQSFG